MKYPGDSKSKTTFNRRQPLYIDSLKFFCVNLSNFRFNYNFLFETTSNNSFLKFYYLIIGYPQAVFFLNFSS